VLSYLVAGLVSGAIYAMSSLGIVLTYNASRTFNFAQGGMAFFIAYCFYWLRTEQGLPTALALVISVLVIAPLLGLFLWAVLLGRLSSATPMVRLAAAIGLSVALSAATTLIFGDKQVFQPRGLVHEAKKAVTIAGVAISNEQLLILGVALVVSLLGYLILNRTTAGLITRGTVDSPLMSSLSGTNPNLVVAGTWMAGVAIAGLAGIMITPQVGLNAVGFDTVVAASFAGVVIGRLTNLWWAFFGSLLVGVLQSIVIPWLPSTGFLATSLRPSLPFIVMVVAIVIQSITRSSIRDDAQTREVASMTSKAERNEARVLALLRSQRGRWDRWVGFALLTVVLFAVPQVFSDFWTGVVALGVCYAVALLSFRLVTGEAGIIGLCQISFIGIGAVATAQLATKHGLPVLPSMIVGGLIAFVCGLVVGVVALPLGQLYAAIVTFAFALLADQVIFTRPEFSNFDSGVTLNRPVVAGRVLDSNSSYFYFASAVFLILAVALWLLRRSNLGLKFATIRSSRNRASTLGLPIYRSRLMLFALGAAVAGLGGGLLGSFQLVAFPGAYSATLGLTFFAVVIAQGSWSMGGAAVAGLSLSVAPALFSNYLPTRLSDLPAVLFGLMAIQVVANPIGINPQLRAGFRALAIKLTPGGPQPLPSPAAPAKARELASGAQK
jgi:branched-chain amino acid transport system permease protein